MTAPRTILVIADVGGEARRHIGDEAMLEANLGGLRRAVPGVEIVLMSRDPDWVSARYGVASVPLFGFPAGQDASVERRQLLEGLRGALASGAGTGPSLDAVRNADAVVLSGGGNLSSTWPDLLAERVALLDLASRLQKPAVVLGQTIGPDLTPEEASDLGTALRSARFVGVRELPSAALAISLGVPIARLWYQTDDALFVGSEEPRTSPRTLRETIAVTVDPQLRASGGGRFDSLASQIRAFAETTGATPVIVPHIFEAASGDGPTDLTEAYFLRDAIALARAEIAPERDARSVAAAVRGAALVVSSRYHPLVFALAAGTPCIGIYGDNYCRIKIEGALAHAKRERWALHFDQLARGALLPLALELWRDRERLGRDLADLREGWRNAEEQRWDAIAQALDSAVAGSLVEHDPSFDGSRPEVVQSLLSALERSRETIQRLESRCSEVERYAIAFESMARPYLTVRRYASKLRDGLRSFGRRD